ncbi:MAG TPA: NUDIX domain-containing protein [Xenococcaceae cyanobacterium]|jgi:8-oxo-dGTP pyrophosphatase MutT (NUDIX family)
MSLSPPLVAMAILYREGKFLMQLRDDVPGILYPGYWGLFGGHLELNETPQEGVIREIKEEIDYQLTQPQKFRCYTDSRAVRYIFYAPLKSEIQALELREGWDLNLIPPSNIIRGVYYSHKAGEEKPLGDIHRRILLDFIKSGLENFEQF